MKNLAHIYQQGRSNFGTQQHAAKINDITLEIARSNYTQESNNNLYPTRRRNQNENVSHEQSSMIIFKHYYKLTDNN